MMNYNTATSQNHNNFDPQSPQYQLHVAYPPNKAKTWKMKTEDDGWVLIHNCIRTEMDRLHKVLSTLLSRLSEKANLKSWEVESLKYIFQIHFQTVHGHHTNEDEILTPVLKQRFAYPNKLEDDHSEIINHIQVIENKLHTLKADDGRKEIQELLDAFVAYEKSLLPHLLEEEQVGLLLMRAYFTQDEIRPVIGKILARTQKLEPFTIGLMIHYLGETYVRNTMMKNEGIPFFVWHLVFKRKMKKFQRKVIVHYVALETNVAVKK